MENETPRYNFRFDSVTNEMLNWLAVNTAPGVEVPRTAILKALIREKYEAMQAAQEAAKPKRKKKGE